MRLPTKSNWQAQSSRWPLPCPDFAETHLETTARKIAQAFGGDIAYRLVDGGAWSE